MVIYTHRLKGASLSNKGVYMYIVKTANGFSSLCHTIDEANDKYCEFRSACEFVAIYKLLIGGATEQIRTSW